MGIWPGFFNRVPALTLTFCFAFWMPPCIVLPTSGLDDPNDCYTTLLDLQRRPSPLSLGHSLRKRERDVAWRRSKARCDPGAQAGTQGRPRAVLSLRTRAVALFACRSYARPLSRSAQPRRQESRSGPASVREAAAASHACGDAGQRIAEENEVAEEREADYFLPN